MVRILLDKTNHTFKTKITDCVIWHHHHHHRCDCGWLYIRFRNDACHTFKSTESSIYTGHFPPSSRVTGVRCLAAAAITILPTLGLPAQFGNWNIFNFHFILGHITRLCNECDLQERERERDCSGWICESCCESKNQEEANKTNLCKIFYPTFAPEEQSLRAHLLPQLGLHLCPNTGGSTQQEVMTQ